MNGQTVEQTDGQTDRQMDDVKPIYPPTRTLFLQYRQISNISNTLVGNQFADHSDVVGASPVNTAPITSSFSI